MSNEQFKLGQEAFKTNPGMSNEQLKMAHPLFRTGYRAAAADAMKRNNVAFPTSLYDIPKRPEVFKADWSDIMAATKRPRFNKLHQDIPAARIILNSIVKAVELKADQIKRYKDVVQLVDEAFDLILQYGYDEGVLTVDDCQQYDYTPIAHK